jgi:hypothetical protein
MPDLEPVPLDSELDALLMALQAADTHSQHLEFEVRRLETVISQLQDHHTRTLFLLSLCLWVKRPHKPVR